MNINILFFGLLVTFIIAEEEETSLSLHSRLRGRLLGRRPHHIADDTNETKTIPVKSAKRKPGGLLRQQILSREVTPGPVSVPKEENVIEGEQTKRVVKRKKSNGRKDGNNQFINNREGLNHDPKSFRIQKGRLSRQKSRKHSKESIQISKRPVQESSLEEESTTPVDPVMIWKKQAAETKQLQREIGRAVRRRPAGSFRSNSIRIKNKVEVDSKHINGKSTIRGERRKDTSVKTPLEKSEENISLSQRNKGLSFRFTRKKLTSLNDNNVINQVIESEEGSKTKKKSERLVINQASARSLHFPRKNSAVKDIVKDSNTLKTEQKENVEEEKKSAISNGQNARIHKNVSEAGLEKAESESRQKNNQRTRTTITKVSSSPKEVKQETSRTSIRNRFNPRAQERKQSKEVQVPHKEKSLRPEKKRTINKELRLRFDPRRKNSIKEKDDSSKPPEETKQVTKKTKKSRRKNSPTLSSNPPISNVNGGLRLESPNSNNIPLKSEIGQELRHQIKDLSHEIVGIQLEQEADVNIDQNSSPVVIKSRLNIKDKLKADSPHHEILQERERTESLSQMKTIKTITNNIKNIQSRSFQGKVTDSSKVTGRSGLEGTENVRGSSGQRRLFISRHEESKSNSPGRQINSDRRNHGNEISAQSLNQTKVPENETPNQGPSFPRNITEVRIKTEKSHQEKVKVKKLKDKAAPKKASASPRFSRRRGYSSQRQHVDTKSSDRGTKIDKRPNTSATRVIKHRQRQITDPRRKDTKTVKTDNSISTGRKIAFKDASVASASSSDISLENNEVSDKYLDIAFKHARATWAQDPFRKDASEAEGPQFDIDYTKDPNYFQNELKVANQDQEAKTISKASQSSIAPNTSQPRTIPSNFFSFNTFTGRRQNSVPQQDKDDLNNFQAVSSETFGSSSSNEPVFVPLFVPDLTKSKETGNSQEFQPFTFSVQL